MTTTIDRRPLHFATVWGVFGFALLLAQAIYRLTPLALEPISSGQLGGWQWAGWAAWVSFMAYSEGYRGFQQQTAPRIVARAFYLGEHPRPLYTLFAPLFCMSLFHATRRRLMVSWGLYLGIITLIIAVRQLSQPWRGMVDAGVVVGLVWGLAAVVYFFLRGLAGHPPAASPEVPEDV